MTEPEWLACEYPILTLKFLHDKSDRKRRLFMVAWARTYLGTNP